MKSVYYRAAVIGGGAAGLTAAAALAAQIGGKNVVILEKQNKPGRKLLATGNGRCNISNRHVAPEHYHGDKALVESVLSGFSVSRMKDFMNHLGVLLREDSEGRIYPYSNQAVTILNALRDECFRKGVTEKLSFVPESVVKENGCFSVRSAEETIRCDYLIFACGSKASPKLGADDSGFRLLEPLGIMHSPLFPALCPVPTLEKRKALKGVRAKGTAAFVCDNKVVKTSAGEIQFSDKGLSGICIFELSRCVSEYYCYGTVEGSAVSKIGITLDLMPDIGFGELCAIIERGKSIYGNEPAKKLLSGMLHQALAEVIVHESRLSGKSCRGLTSRDIRVLAGTIKRMCFTPEKAGSFDTAQVCAGGIGSEAVDAGTLMAKKVKNLYICGEMLNVDGDCGGFNLHFALGSALLAARLGHGM